MKKIKIRPHPHIKNVFISGSSERPRLYTKNPIKGKTIYGEKLYHDNKIEYREWNPYRSKLAAIILKHPSTKFLIKNHNCLYLGAASGTTVSHLSDILSNGIVYALEFAERSIRQLIQNSSERMNVVPILGDARFPIKYAKSIFTNINIIYQDVAQPNQAEIAIRNSDYYLKEDGILILVIKSQSIDSVSKSEKVYKKEKKILQQAGLAILENINIQKYALNHTVLIARK
ncbi:MAG: fibrillarin-like rRNA/tRNA 2'-O-methyltransferase [Candidatus Lokiarchaeota archaeon]|nr:fibrillarin-like rRNA/tRNA 2'-O-methyltransferase [Candidatus Lokiarchaeota archaeon]